MIVHNILWSILGNAVDTIPHKSLGKCYFLKDIKTVVTKHRYPAVNIL